MSVTTPTPNAEIPADLAAAIETARNNLTLLQAEARRLQALGESLEREVSALAASKADLDAEIPLLLARNAEAEESAAKAEERAATARAEAQEAAADADAARVEAELARSEAAERIAAAEKIESALRDRSQRIALSEAQFSVDRGALDARIKRIAEAIA